ncbi:MAG: hypothetical protein JF599_11065 [Verrucomicrobia bacterium]|nr:hypothetical protein [Verrucomicrobiota bacterium]
MFEQRKQRLLTRRQFFHRLARSAALGAGLIAFSLLVGVLGYHFVGELSWIDAYLDAAMILSGMGPVSTLHSVAAKFFAGTYAIYCGITLISTAGIIFAPVIHRFLHKFHVEEDAKP